MVGFYDDSRRELVIAAGKNKQVGMPLHWLTASDFVSLLEKLPTQREPNLIDDIC